MQQLKASGPGITGALQISKIPCRAYAKFQADDVYVLAAPRATQLKVIEFPSLPPELRASPTAQQELTVASASDPTQKQRVEQALFSSSALVPACPARVRGACQAASGEPAADSGPVVADCSPLTTCPLSRPAGDVLELAVLVAIRLRDDAAMERAFAQAKAFYTDTRCEPLLGSISSKQPSMCHCARIRPAAVPAHSDTHSLAE